ncbi:hypothetical protein HYV86_00370 [Candidatus Woesearchaeota archaeon]|nr:hypothetical protein [Candidatus Woesearchaeota archaeon]
MASLRSILLTLLVLVFLVGCTVQSIDEIKTEENVGKTFVLKGTVHDSFKIGELSGYTLKDEQGGSIAVGSKSLPAEGEIVTVKGVLIRDSLFGYYLKVNEE